MYNYPDYNSSFGGQHFSQMSSNIIYVASLEEALTRNRPGTENTYFHQDKQIFYRVKTEYDGRKFWQEFEYHSPTPSESNVPVTRKDLTEITERIIRIENLVFQSEASNEQSNG